MTKMSNRILSLVLTVLMMVSMVAVFTLPAIAATEETDYEALFEGAYLINPSWSAADLVDDRILYFNFRGTEREIVCDTSLHFNNWAAAEASAYALDKVTADNIYEYTPVFVFAPGTYSSVIHVPTNAVILGANAGVSPNAPVEEGDWTVDAVKENGGWKTNPARDTANETVFTARIYHATRIGASYGDHGANGTEPERFAYWLEAAKQAGRAEPLNLTIDGVKVQHSAAMITVNHYDYNQDLKYPASAGVIKNTSLRTVNFNIKNSVLNMTSNIVSAANGAHNIYKANITDCDIYGQNAQLFQRDIAAVNLTRIYWHDVGASASLWNNSNLIGYNLVGTNNSSSAYHTDYGDKVTTVVKDSLFYNIASDNDRTFMVGANLDKSSGGANNTTYSHIFDGNIFYDARSAATSQGASVINCVDHDKTSAVELTVKNNQFHQEGRYVYSPVSVTANHTSKNDIVVYENNTVTGKFDCKDIDSAEPVDFNRALEDGITINGVKFTEADTAVFAPSDAVVFEQSKTKKFFISFIGDTKYKFTIDNVNVFPYATITAESRKGYTTLAALKDFEGKNIIMPAGFYGNNIDFTFAANYYGASFGIDPNDKSTATAENNYDWAANDAWGKYGVSRLHTIRTYGNFAGDLVLDGFKQTARFWDNERNSTDPAALNIVIKNFMLDDGDREYVASTDTNRFYNLNNGRTSNGTSGSINNTTLGAAYKDSFTIENLRVVGSGNHRDFINEYVPAHVTLKGLYIDGAAAVKGRSPLAFFKLGVNNMNGSVTVTGCNLRNGLDANPLICVESYGSKSGFVQMTDQRYAVTVTDNIFYNAVKGAGSIVRVRTGLVSSLAFNNNTVINTDNYMTGNVVASINTHTNLDTLLLKNNITLGCNTLIGIDESMLASDFNMGEYNPKATSHVWSATATPNGDATCVDMGTATVKCQNCPATQTVAGTAYGDHTWNAGVYHNDATCQADGTKTQTCTVCNTATQTVTAAGTKVGHDYKETAYVSNNDATCITAGTETAKCTWCDATKTRTNADKYPATGAHVYGEYVSNNDASYRADGTKTAKCTTTGCTATHTVTDEGTKKPAPAAVDSSKTFKDVKSGKWYKEAVDHAAAYGLVSGIDKDVFGVDVTVTRGMFVTILARIAGVDTSNAANKAATTKFTDVKVGKFYTAAIAWANANGIVAGKSATTFEPETAISRQELAVMIVNFAEAQGITLTEKNKAITFADASSIAGWAKKEVAACQKAGIISGYNEGGKTLFKPTNTATRAEAVQMLYKFHMDFYLK